MKKLGALKPEEDPFGQGLLAQFKGRGVLEIVERDDGYIDAMNCGTYFSEYEDWPSVEKKAMDLVKGKVLDVGCGAGRHSLYLQNRGFDVTGIDISPLAIEVCKLRGLKKTKVVPIEDLDFAPGSFDTVIMMGNNFGLFGNFKKAQRLLRKLHRMTSDDALIIADTRDPYKTDNPAHIEYHKANKEKGRMGGQVRIRVRFKKYVGKWFDYLMVSKEEMRGILKNTEWKIGEFIDSEGAEYIAVIEKRSAHLNLNRRRSQ